MSTDRAVFAHIFHLPSIKSDVVYHKEIGMSRLCKKILKKYSPLFISNLFYL